MTVSTALRCLLLFVCFLFSTLLLNSVVGLGRDRNVARTRTTDLTPMVHLRMVREERKAWRLSSHQFVTICPTHSKSDSHVKLPNQHEGNKDIFRYTESETIYHPSELSQETFEWLIAQKWENEWRTRKTWNTGNPTRWGVKGEPRMTATGQMWTVPDWRRKGKHDRTPRCLKDSKGELDNWWEQTKDARQLLTLKRFLKTCTEKWKGGQRKAITFDHMAQLWKALL